MEIICECGHGIEEHGLLGCIDPKVARWNDCNCKLPKEAVEARYWARVMVARYIGRVMWCEMLEKERDDLQTELAKTLSQRDVYKIRLWGQYCKKCSKDNKYDTSDAYVHASKYCPNCGKKMVWITANGEPLTYAELQEELRMCRLALRTMDSAQAELASYTKIAVDALKEIAPNNPGQFNFGIAQDALDKIKRKF